MLRLFQNWNCIPPSTWEVDETLKKDFEKNASGHLALSL